MAATSAVDELRKDHGILKRDLEAIGATVRAVGQDSQGTQAALDGSLRERLAYYAAGMQLHFRREEEGLFPDAQRMVSEDASRTSVIGAFFGEEAEDDLGAHMTLRTRVGEMIGVLDEAALAGQIGEQTPKRLRALLNVIENLLARHAAKEDDFIFPMIERSLTTEQQQAVLSRLSAIAPGAGAGDPRMRQAEGLGAADADAD